MSYLKFITKCIVIKFPLNWSKIKIYKKNINADVKNSTRTDIRGSITSSDSDVFFAHRTWWDSSTIKTAQSRSNMLFCKRLSIVYEVTTTLGQFVRRAGLFWWPKTGIKLSKLREISSIYMQIYYATHYSVQLHEMHNISRSKIWAYQNMCAWKKIQRCYLLNKMLWTHFYVTLLQMKQLQFKASWLPSWITL